MTYEVLITEEIAKAISHADKKTQRIIKNNLKKLKQNPFPSQGHGNKKRLPVSGKERFRMHIGISELIPINEAHKKYGY